MLSYLLDAKQTVGTNRRTQERIPRGRRRSTRATGLCASFSNYQQEVRRRSLSTEAACKSPTLGIRRRMTGDQRGLDQQPRLGVSFRQPVLHRALGNWVERSRAGAELGLWGRLHICRSRRRESKGFKSAFTQAFTGCFSLRAARTINSPWLGFGTTALEPGIGDRKEFDGYIPSQ